ncbi:MAG: hypothetical protein ACKPKO_03735 [Candidatus Fonsibacter sp.]
MQSIKFQMVMNGSANRAWRSARQITTVRKTTTVVSYENSQLIFQFINAALFPYVGPTERCSVLRAARL